jgi:DNA-binding MarR family transcriptional regulator
MGPCQVQEPDLSAERVPEANTTALLGKAYSVLGHRIVAGVVDAGFPQRPAHSAVFAHVDRDGTRLTVLAERANITPQAMGELVDDLELRGYILRRPDPEDGRAKLITLTPTGVAAVEAAGRTIMDIERRLDAEHGAEAMRVVRSILRSIARADEGRDADT